jgi:pyruvate ferredoxin oxidoreductase beta subunit
MGRLAVRTGMWALFEVENGEFKWSGPSARLVDKSKRKPIEQYLKAQGRFRRMTDEDIDALQSWVDRSWEHYKKLM